MKNNPEISVIVTNYNHSKYIEQAVESVQKQTFDDIEIIIVDDCSTDNSKDIINGLVAKDPSLRTIFLKENRGKWFALNTAIEQAKGKLITLQDADDASCQDRLGRQKWILETNGSYHNLCGFTHCYSDEDMQKAIQWKPVFPGIVSAPTMEHADVVRHVNEGHKAPGINHYFVGQKYEVHGASTMFYKQLWTHGMKFLPGNMGLRCQRAEDSDHNTKMTLLLQKTSVLKEPLYCYRRNTSTNNAYLEEL